MPVYNYTTLDGPFLGDETFATGINAAGQIVGYYIFFGHHHGFIYNPNDSTYTSLDALSPALSSHQVGVQFTDTSLYGINASGKIVGYAQETTPPLSDPDSFLYSGGTYTVIDDPDRDFYIGYTIATGINDLGWVVGYYLDEDSAFHDSWKGFLTSDGIHYNTIDDPLGAGGTYAIGINSVGQIVGYYLDASNHQHGFLYDGRNGGTYTTLDDPLATNGTFATGINKAGQIVGYYTDSSGGHGFLYSGGRYTTINDPLATNGTFASGINDAGQIVGFYRDSINVNHGFVLTITPNPPPPPATTSAMILRGANNSPYAAGHYEIYDIGNNAILAGYELDQIGINWQFVGLGGFFGGDTTDMLLRNSATGGFVVDDISNNLITNAAFLGTVGLDWQVMGFGNFSSLGENDMILRNVNTGGVEVYDIRNNQIIGANFMGTVGLSWHFSGVGNFSGHGTSDMILRDTGIGGGTDGGGPGTGGLEVYNINNNQITGAAFIGTVGLDWQFSGVGNFSGVLGETDLLLRNVNTGGLEVYDINNNQITGAAFIGTVGLDWQFAGIAPIHAAGASDLVLRNKNTGQFEVYDIAGNTLVGAASLGTVGLDWQLGGFAVVDPPTASGTFSDISNDQLVQAMAGFGGDAADDFNGVFLGDDTQSFLTTPQPG